MARTAQSIVSKWSSWPVLPVAGISGADVRLSSRHRRFAPAPIRPESATSVPHLDVHVHVDFGQPPGHCQSASSLAGVHERPNSRPRLGRATVSDQRARFVSPASDSDSLILRRLAAVVDTAANPFSRLSECVARPAKSDQPGCSRVKNVVQWWSTVGNAIDCAATGKPLCSSLPVVLVTNHQRFWPVRSDHVQRAQPGRPDGHHWRDPPWPSGWNDGRIQQRA